MNKRDLIIYIIGFSLIIYSLISLQIFFCIIGLFTCGFTQFFKARENVKGISESGKGINRQAEPYLILMIFWLISIVLTSLIFAVIDYFRFFGGAS